MTIKTRRVVWTAVFLGITLAAIVMEVVAGVWHPAGTIPWTEYIATYVPWPIQLIAYVTLAVWLPFHFWRHDHLKNDAYARGLVKGLAAAEPNLSLASTREMLDELVARGEAEVWDKTKGEDLAAGAAELKRTMTATILAHRPAARLAIPAMTATRGDVHY